MFQALVEARAKEKRAKLERNETASDLMDELSDPGCRVRKDAQDSAAALVEI